MAAKLGDAAVASRESRMVAQRERGMTYAQIGEANGISVSRVRQIFAKRAYADRRQERLAASST